MFVLCFFQKEVQRGNITVGTRTNVYGSREQTLIFCQIYLTFHWLFF